MSDPIERDIKEGPTDIHCEINKDINSAISDLGKTARKEVPTMREAAQRLGKLSETMQKFSQSEVSMEEKVDVLFDQLEGVILREHSNTLRSIEIIRKNFKELLKNKDAKYGESFE